MAGHLDDHWATWLNEMVLHRDSGGTTTLTGPVADQAQLHGLLAKIRDLGVTLLSVQLQTAGDQPPLTAGTQPSDSPAHTTDETTARAAGPDNDRTGT